MRVAQADRALAALNAAPEDSARIWPDAAMERMLLGALEMVQATPVLLLEAAAPAARPVPIEELLAAHYRFVWRTLRRLGVHEALVDDAAQKVFLVASSRLDTVTPGKERSFLMGVSVRVAANSRRAQSQCREHADPDAVAAHATQTTPEELLEWKQRREQLDRWLAALDIELRAPFVLFELEGLALTEIADVLELPLGTVKTRLRKARAIFLEAASAGGAR